MIKQVLLVLLLAVLVAFYFRERTFSLFPVLFGLFNATKPSLKSQVLFTSSELKLYNGVKRPELYLALLGNVFDVTKGEKHYGPGQSYNAFVGRDATRNFITGDFEEETLSDDVTGLKEQDLRALNDWVKFYKKDYKRIGKLIGRYYNEEGKLTPYGKQIRKLIKQAEVSKENQDLEKVKFPPCNVEWEEKSGTRVWCTSRSGGIERNWVGVPKQLYEPGSQSYRCACIGEDNSKLGNIKDYEGCEDNSPSCFVKKE